MSLGSYFGFVLLAWASHNPTVLASSIPPASVAKSANYGLNDAAKAAGKLWFGTAADIPGTGEADDPYYMAEFNNTHDFGGATPANIMKVSLFSNIMCDHKEKVRRRKKAKRERESLLINVTTKYEFTEPEQGVFNFTGGDYFLDVAEASGKIVRCHNLIWYNELPTWVTNPTVNWTNETLSAVLTNHVTNLVEHFGDRCYSWDVVNEALSDSPAGAWQDNIWYDTIGPEYFFLAFEAATKAVRKNHLKVKLYYNDYNIESAGDKSTAAQGLVSQLQERGIQIDGVGLESHFIAGETPSQSEQEANMQAFIQLGVEVAVTELDVRLYLPPNATTEAQQVSDYSSTVAACTNVKGCVGITVWDFDGKNLLNPPGRGPYLHGLQAVFARVGFGC